VGTIVGHLAGLNEKKITSTYESASNTSSSIMFPAVDGGTAVPIRGAFAARGGTPRLREVPGTSQGFEFLF
jgi:hypothetical protein